MSREDRGEPDEAAARRHARLSELLVAALERPAGERARFLRERCPDDEALVDEALALLAHEDAEARLDLAGALPAVAPAEELAPGFTLVRVIGQGGMGTVYEAVQDSPRRRVAFKVVSGPGLGGEALRRFEREAHILGCLQHPGICQVHEVGRTRSGEPWFAMELVDGLTLTRHADAARLGREERLALCCRVCDAVAHAHARGIVHRDLKPDNVLVTRDGQPKVLDFGVARASDLTVGSTLLTHTGAVIGTVAYMSPEQAAGEAQVDARSDVFSLGVLLFELLTGERPARIEGLTLAQALHVIQRDDPTRAVATKAGLRGDLRTILTKTLEQDPARRYEDASALAEDLRRHLAHEPIVARPPSIAYRVAKFSRRHRGLVIAMSLVFLSLLVGALVALDQARRAADGERLADERTLDAERQAYRATLVAVSSAIEAGRFRTAREELARAPASLRGWEAAHFEALLSHAFGRELHPGPAFGARLSADGALAYTVHLADDAAELVAFSLPDGGLRGRFDLRARPIVAPGEAWAIVLAAIFRLHPEGVEVELVDADGLAPPRRVRTCACEPRSDLGFPLDERGEHALVPVARGVELCELATGHLASAPIDLGITTSLSPDGRRVLRTSSSVSSLLDARTGEVLWSSPESTDGYSSGAFSPDGRSFYTTGLILDPVLRRWSLERGEVLAERPLELNASGESWAFSPDGAALVIAPGRRELRVFDAALETELARRQLPACDQAELALGSGARRLVAALGTAGLRTWDLARPPARAVLAGHESYVYSVAVSPDGTRLASGDFRGGLRTWDLANQRPLAIVREASRSSIGHVEWSLDGRRLLFVWDKRIWSVDAESGAELARAELAGPVLSLARRPGCEELLVAQGGRVLVLDGETLTELRSLPGGVGCWSPDGAALAVAGLERVVAVHDARDLAERWRVEGPAAVRSVAWSPDGRALALSGERGCPILSAETGVPLARIEGESGFALAWSPESGRLVLAQGDGRISFWDAETGAQVVSFEDNPAYVKDLAFSPDGRTLATAGGDGAVRLWLAAPE